MDKIKHLKISRADKIGFTFFFAIVLSTTLIWLFEERFDQDQWFSQRNLRYKMADDIIDSKLLINKTKKEVITLLGPESPSELEGREHLSYRLGKTPSFFESKEEILVVIFKNGKVSHVINREQN